jgi:hypothetical protein
MQIITGGVQGLNIKPTFHILCYKMLILNFKRPTSSHFFVFRESGLTKSCSSSEGLSEYKISWFYIDLCKFYSHLKSLNVFHFGMVAATALKLRSRSHLQWHGLPTEVHKNQSVGPELDREDRHTERMVISLAYLFPLGRNVG